MDNTDVIMYKFPDSKDRLLMFTDFYVMNEIHIPSLRAMGPVIHPEGSHYVTVVVFVFVLTVVFFLY